MLSNAMQDALNQHLNREFQSSYLYLAMAASCESSNLPGFGHWLRVQAREELGHAMRFYDYILDRGSHVALAAVAQPPAEFASPQRIFEEALGHEQQITAQINTLASQASQEQDHATQNFLQWFVTEQVEEEKSASQIVANLQMIGDNQVGLYMLDKELGARAGA